MASSLSLRVRLDFTYLSEDSETILSDFCSIFIGLSYSLITKKGYFIYYF